MHQHRHQYYIGARNDGERKIEFWKEYNLEELFVNMQGD
jgi:hypothetical protein